MVAEEADCNVWPRSEWCQLERLRKEQGAAKLHLSLIPLPNSRSLVSSELTNPLPWSWNRLSWWCTIRSRTA